MTKTAQTKSKQRIADHGEVFTADREVKAMLDLVKVQSERINARFLEPACGTGNFLVEILRRKLTVCLSQSQINKSQKSPKYAQTHYERLAIEALCHIYGIELLSDNVAECRLRLFHIFLEHYQSHFSQTNPQVLDVAQFVLGKNIVQGNALSLKQVDSQQQDTDQPIIFSEWSFVGPTQIKRHDYIYQKLVDKEDQFQSYQDFRPIFYLDLPQGVPNEQRNK
ncbi:restriction endonuclease subunit M [Pasteurellaceae bacterium RH1A]|nr:restriction endonuclease subunit M [Pasteurellaceae bacterium RH1A]